MLKKKFDIGLTIEAVNAGSLLGYGAEFWLCDMVGAEACKRWLRTLDRSPLCELSVFESKLCTDEQNLVSYL